MPTPAEAATPPGGSKRPRRRAAATPQPGKVTAAVTAAAAAAAAVGTAPAATSAAAVVAAAESAAAAAVAGTPVAAKKRGAKPPAKSPSALVLDNRNALEFKAGRIAELLERLYPNPPIPLDHGTHFQLLCAVLLSAQTTDKKVNECTPALFDLAPDAPSMAAAPLEDIAACIRQLGLAPTKAKNLKAMAQLLVEQHGGQVPASMEALEALPGVGHKTASVVMCQAFGQAAFPVDTHIHRLAQRWGLTDGRNVEQTEADLKLLFPERLWKDLHLQIIFFGREKCPAQRHDPVHCPVCSWAAVPPYDKAGVSPSKAGGPKKAAAAGSGGSAKKEAAAPGRGSSAMTAAAAAASRQGAPSQATPFRATPARRGGSVRRALAGRSARLIAAAGEGDREMESQFEKELRRRGLDSASIGDEADTAAATTPRTPLEQQQGGQQQQRRPRPPPSFARDNSDEVPPQLERSRALNSEGLEGLPARAAELLKLGLTFFLAFAPFILVVALAFGGIYFVFGDAFVHGGSPSSGPPPYIDPDMLLAEPTADPMIPLDLRVRGSLPAAFTFQNAAHLSPSVASRNVSQAMGKGGKMVAADEAAELLLQSEQYAPFLAEGFDAACFASRSLTQTHSTAQAQTEALQAGVSALDGALRQLVLRHQDDLIAQTARLTDAESAVQRIGLSVRSLQMVAARVRAEVAEPYAQIAERTRQLRNLQATVDLLRHIIHRLKLVQKLRAQMAAADGVGIIETAKAAKLLSEIAAVDAEADLSGVEAVEADAEFLQTAAALVHGQTEAALKAGLDCLSQADVGSALQVLFNLGELKQGVEALADAAAAGFARELGAALDPRKLSASSVAGGRGPGGAKAALQGLGAPPGSTQKVAEALWEKLGAALELLQKSAVEVWHLQRVLAKKRDPLSHTLFLDVVAPGEEDPLPLDRFWSRAIAGMADAFAGAFSTARGGFVRDTLVASFPRLGGLLEGAAARVLRDSAARDIGSALDEEQIAALLASAGDFQAAYLAAALARLSEAAGTAFPGSSRALPTAADLQKSIARVHEELKAASGSPRLALLVAGVVGQSLGMMAEKAELMAASGPELRAVGPGSACNSAQLRNISLCNCLQEVHRSMGGLLGRLPPDAAEALRGPLGSVHAAAVEAVAPTIRAMVDAAEETLLRVHATPAYTAAPTADGPIGAAAAAAGGGMVDTSPYMSDLSRLLTHCRLEFLTKFNPSPASPVPSVARSLVERMAARLVLFAVRHASLLRPLPQAGKLQLAKDLAEMEAAVGQQLLPLEQLGGPARALRAFRRLLFLETAEVEGSPVLRELPRPEVLHHLYSRAPPQLESPHARSSLTPAQYSLWLDNHSQAEALKFIRTALEACAARARGAPGADELLPLLRRLAADAS
ncbi:conserved oligomeric Golgi complex subunit 5 [Micractinium conductrix]|uniref:Conserved oligomeric Golgi complex subunit 5 n=1 Tax=Micractinium conductrix TaxID=554055 RepID=A0A2P6VQT4_9CHLO|nr:conserved oligomeric Golgi complex subunit 5 [Micractinium conductrix]|eukprot:PSC76466.1 conserved oligomeric Golgi complex subunit 5 [Micractinium conductrix]